MELKIGDLFLIGRPMRENFNSDVVYKMHLVELIAIEATGMVFLKNYTMSKRLYSSISFPEVNDATSIEHLKKNGQRLDSEIGKLLYV